MYKNLYAYPRMREVSLGPVTIVWRGAFAMLEVDLRVASVFVWTLRGPIVIRWWGWR